jgi:AGZA family xanthine/uracil permease-like MFS transporter
MIDLSDVLAAVAVILNGIPQGLLALGYGFATQPTGLGFLASGIMIVIFGSVAPVSFQAETITMAGVSGRDRIERISIVVIGGVIVGILAALGMFTRVVDYAGGVIVSAMMTGVGVILTIVAIRFAISNKMVGIISMVVGVITYFVFDQLGDPNKVIYTILASVIAASIYANVTKRFKPVTVAEEDDKIRWFGNKLVFNRWVLKGILATFMMNIGGNLAFGKITESLANLGGERAVVNVDHLTLYSAVFDIASGLFGGGCGEAIISGTATSSHPVTSAALLSFGMAAVLLLGLLPKIGKYVPSESIAGFLLVLGVVLTFFPNSNLALGGAPTTNIVEWVTSGGFFPYLFQGNIAMNFVAVITALVTCFAFNPFTGLVAGLTARGFVTGSVLEIIINGVIFLATVYFFHGGQQVVHKMRGSKSE